MGPKMKHLQESAQARGVAIKGQCVSSNTLSGRVGVSREAAAKMQPRPQALGHGPKDWKSPERGERKTSARSPPSGIPTAEVEKISGSYPSFLVFSVTLCLCSEKLFPAAI
jgi:hypothetical protein